MDVLLAPLIDTLEALPEHPSVEGLRHVILKTKVLEIPLDEYVKFSDKGYARHNVYGSRRCEITKKGAGHPHT